MPRGSARRSRARAPTCSGCSASRYNPAAVAAVRAAGYLGATTVNPGLASPSQPFTLNRIRVNYSDGVSGFVAKMQRYVG
jgi:hypothetical protein